MVGLVHTRRWEKINRSNGYWRVIKVCVSSMQHFISFSYYNISYFILQHTIASWGIELYFELYQVFMLHFFKYFDQKNQAIFIQKCFNTLRPKYDSSGKICSLGGKMFQYPHVVYYTWLDFLLMQSSILVTWGLLMGDFSLSKLLIDYFLTAMEYYCITVSE